MSTIIRGAAAVFLVAHGVAHIVGFLASWQLRAARDTPDSTWILNGTVDVGDAGMRLFGILWLVAAVAFLAAAVAIWRGNLRFVAVVTVGSLALCLVGLPNAAVGVWIDVAILVLLAARALVRPAAPRPVLR